jgi:cytidylate kinase
MTDTKRRLLSVAIDGPAGAGKSTVARRVAQALGYTYVDTGAMYRAVAWAVVDQEVDPHDADAVTQLANGLDILLTPDTRVFIGWREVTMDIRTPSMSSLASAISAIPGVRTRMVALQRDLGAAGGVVMEGRDIGTVVLPDAEVKVYLTASLERRVRRREQELAGKGMSLPRETLTAQIIARDTRDEGRADSPMRPAVDAVLLDSDHLDADEVVARILTLHREALNRVDL